MIRFCTHDEIDPIKWNGRIEHSSFPTVFADYDLLSLVSPDWCALILDDYEAVMPLPTRCKWGASYVYTPFFISRLGLFATAPSAQLMRDFVSALPKQYKQCDLCLNPNNDVSALSQNSYQMMASHSLAMNLSYEALQAHYSENTHRNLKTAAKYNLSLTVTDMWSIENLFLNNRGKEKGVAFKVADYEMLLCMADFWWDRDLVDLVGVKNETGKLIAGACFLKDHQRRWFLFSGRDNAESDKRAMFYLIDEYIKKHAGEDVILDFNGSMNPNVARFYAGFGAQRYEFPVLNYIPNSWLAPLIRCYRRLRS